MNCDAFREIISDMLAEGDNPVSRTDLAAHLETCPACKCYLRESEATWNLLRPSHHIKASPGFKERTMNRIARMETQIPRPAERRRFESKYWKIAAIAACVAGLLLLTPFSSLFKPEGVAYALADTIKANLGLRSIHVQMETTTSGTVTEMWIECDDSGKPTRVRRNFAETEDGAKDVVLRQDSADVWFREKKALTTVREKNALVQMAAEVNQWNPRLMMEKLEQARAAGKINMAVTEPSAPDQSITLSVTHKDHPGMEVYQVDPDSKVVTLAEFYHAMDGRSELTQRIRFLDYNKPIDPEVFELKPPADVVRVDQRRTDIGLPKGNLTDFQISEKVARSFYEALIAQDYDKAGIFVGGLPGSWLRQHFEKAGIVRFLGIESVGKPYMHPNAGTEGIVVPCSVEYETSTTKKIGEFTPGVRRIYGQPDRWAIFGGI